MNFFRITQKQNIQKLSNWGKTPKLEKLVKFGKFGKIGKIGKIAKTAKIANIRKKKFKMKFEENATKHVD